MWCIPKLAPEFIERMEDVLDLYAQPYNPEQPALCFDEKSKELRADTRPGQPTQKNNVRRRDYEYRRNGTANIFLAVEPKGGYRSAEATPRRTRPDFAKELRRIISLPRYHKVKKFHLVLDNLNTHNEQSLAQTFGQPAAQRLLRNAQFHYTPKHASWLNMAEIEIGVMSAQAIRGRIPNMRRLRNTLQAWARRRNRRRAIITWTFTKEKARIKFHYKSAKLS